MAPKRKQSNADSPVVFAGRVTRSSTRHATAALPAAQPEPNKKKRAKTAPAAAKLETEALEKLPDGSKTIIIEHCKQCNSFKTRAALVKDGLEKGVPGVKVLVNPEKPRRGCFEIREEGGGIFVSLLDMKRPFSPMKKLDMEKVVADTVDKIK